MRIPTLPLWLLAFCPAAGAFPSALLEKSDSWFQSTDGKAAVANVLSWQSDFGSWPKNQDNSRKPYLGERRKLKGTFDNGSTTDELRFLSRAFHATGDAGCRDAFLKGFDGILNAQFPNGGWPQYFPLSKQYHRHITFNDNAMIRLMEFLTEVGRDESYSFVGDARRGAAEAAVHRGVDCILKCQVSVNGRRTVWCAQHDEVTLAPADARAFELASLSGSESAGILRFLMSLDDPSPEVVRAVKAGVAWFDASKIPGIRLERVGKERRVIRDAKAPPVWARFYEIETNRPFFCGRDGVRKYEISEIEPERRNGYAWYGNWGESVAAKYAKWKYR